MPEPPGDLRLGCLELYVRLINSGGASPPEATPAVPAGRFTIEEDQRGRVLLRWRDVLGGDGSTEKVGQVDGEVCGGERCRTGHDASGCPVNFSSEAPLAEQTWQVSCALQPQDPEAVLFSTLGLEAVDWLWDGFSSLVLALGLDGNVEANSLARLASNTTLATSAPPFSRELHGGTNGVFACDGQEHRGGFISLCLEEICRRAKADLDPERFCLGLSAWELAGSETADLLAARCEDASHELRFETVRFEAASEAMALLDAAGLFALGSAASVRCKQRHVFVRVVVFDALHESLAAVHFAQIASSGVNDADGGGVGSACNIATDREALSTLLEAASTGESLDDLPDNREMCRLFEVLKPLIAGNCKPFLLCSVPELPKSRSAATEAHRLLDLVERSSLITSQCTCVRGVSRGDFQLADFGVVLQRVRGFAQRCNGLRPPPRGGGSGNGSGREPLPEPAAEPPAAVVGVPRDMRGTASARVGAGQGTDAEGRRLDPRENASEVACVELDSSSAPGVDDTSCYAPPPRTSATGLVAAPNLETNEPLAGVVAATRTLVASIPSHSGAVIEARAAQEACVEECRELGAACAALRARNEAKASRQKRELREAQAEVSELRGKLADIEDSCEAPELLASFRGEAEALRAEVERLREENAALRGAHGEESRRRAQRATVQAMQDEAKELRKCAGEVEQGEKRAKLVHRCLEEVGSRIDVAKRRLREAERDYSTLQPAYGDLGRQIEQAERQRRWVQDELDKLRRTSNGLQAEVGQLREVRSAIDALPPAPGDDVGRTSHLTNSSGIESFAALQRRLPAVAPKLIPLAARARAEMEELMRCCQRLQERQRRLEKVVPFAEEVDTESMSLASSSVMGSTPGARSRARSSDASTGGLGLGLRQTPRRGLSVRAGSQDRCHGPHTASTHSGCSSSVSAGGAISGHPMPRGCIGGAAVAAAAAGVAASASLEKPWGTSQQPCERHGGGLPAETPTPRSASRGATPRATPQSDGTVIRAGTPQATPRRVVTCMRDPSPRCRPPRAASRERPLRGGQALSGRAAAATATFGSKASDVQRPSLDAGNARACSSSQGMGPYSRVSSAGGATRSSGDRCARGRSEERLGTAGGSTGGSAFGCGSAPDPGLRGAAGVLSDLGLHTPPGAPGFASGVQLLPDPQRRRSKSQDNRPASGVDRAPSPWRTPRAGALGSARGGGYSKAPTAAATARWTPR
mmetsp:Transcript_42748/g.118021  ORF Transcript_42748/g.118021 Transcript_42748/m.118021 type:complete len:1218 (+) Transcript_42748:144-3797(+)